MKKVNHGNGFVTGYVLFGIALLSVVISGIASMRNRDAESRLISTQRDAIIQDALTIRNALLQCGALFPAGRNNDANTGAPAFPATGNGMVSDLTCPGSPATGDTLWTTLTRSGSISLNAPPQRIGMTRWQYANTRLSDGRADVFFFIEPLDPADTRSSNLLYSSVRNRRLNPDAGGASATALFSIVPTTRADGRTVARLRSRSLAN